MKRYLSLGSLLAVPVLAVMLATLPGCPAAKDSNKPADGGKGGATDGDTSAKAAEPFPVEATDAVIKGRVVYDGTPPEMKEIKAIADNNDKAHCQKGPTKEQSWMVGKDGGVMYAVVSVEPPAGKFFALDEKQANKYKSEADVAIDQPYCAFDPHVTAVFAGYKAKDGKLHDTKAVLTVKNSGELSHNTKSDGDGKKNKFNFGVNPKEDKTVDLKYQKNPMEIACDKHNWMRAYVVTFEHPFFAVTDKDGNFEIKNAPSGAKLTIKVWHEQGTPATKEWELKAGPNDVGEIKIKAAS
jgi:hypothetical protein